MKYIKISYDESNWISFQPSVHNKSFALKIITPIPWLQQLSGGLAHAWPGLPHENIVWFWFLIWPRFDQFNYDCEKKYRFFRLQLEFLKTSFSYWIEDILKIMSQRGKRTLVDNPAPRRSPRISTKDVEERTKSLMATPKTKRVPTPPRAKKSNLMVPNNDGIFCSNYYSCFFLHFVHNLLKQKLNISYSTK